MSNFGSLIGVESSDRQTKTKLIEEAVSKVMEMDVEELIATLPTKEQPMKLEPIRLL